MIVFELVNDEKNPVYQNLSIDNLRRQYDFLTSLVDVANSLNRSMATTALIQALNFQAIACLHISAGIFRPCEVTVGDYRPPQHYRVPELMNILINEVNRIWETADAVALGAYVLWKINAIHPFINGNGRTARALCYYVICMKSGGLLKGEKILPELIKRDRMEYVQIMKRMDADTSSGKQIDLQPMIDFLTKLLNEQLESEQPQT
ncbi:MAG: Fic family protein [Minwuia sp.]|nr:Fic family protein [Minwuia sp.]